MDTIAHESSDGESVRRRPGAGGPHGGSLDGIRVVDVTQNLAGPYATQTLADLGADVIKVEPPGGDPARAWGPPFVDGESPLFLCANRNKRSVVLDLKTEHGKRALWRLIEGADVFAQSFRPDAAERLGFGYSSVRAASERIVYLSVSAFGDRGPDRELPGYDPLVQARAGIMSVTGERGGPPVRVGTSIVDLSTGLWGAVGVLSALREREATGGGTLVQTSLLDTALSWMAYHVQGFEATGEPPERMGSGIGMIVPYGAFPTSDGRVMIAAGNDRIFGRLCRALGRPEWATDDRFSTNARRVGHREELEAEIAALTRVETAESLGEALRRAEVPYAPIQDVREVARDAQVLESGMLRGASTDAGGGHALDIAPPLLLGGNRPRLRRRPPKLGEHTEEILAELGLDDEGGSGG